MKGASASKRRRSSGGGCISACPGVALLVMVPRSCFMSVQARSSEDFEDGKKNAAGTGVPQATRTAEEKKGGGGDRDGRRSLARLSSAIFVLIPLSLSPFFDGSFSRFRSENVTARSRCRGEGEQRADRAREPRPSLFLHPSSRSSTLTGKKVPSRNSASFLARRAAARARGR